MQGERWQSERGRTTVRDTEDHETTSIKAPSFCCAQQLQHTVSIKRMREEGENMGRRSGKTHAESLSLGLPRGNDQTLSFTSPADGHQGPSTLICLLFCYGALHFSPPFLCSPRSPPPQAAPVIGCPTVLDRVLGVLVRVCIYICMFLGHRATTRVCFSILLCNFFGSHHNFMIFYDF